MQLDQPTAHGDTASESSGAASTLSQAAFASPLEFLEVLQKDFSKIAPHGGPMSKNDLILYAQQGDDEAGRMAAKVAVDHFDTLMSMTQENHQDENGGDQLKVISANDLKQDIAYEKGTALALAPEIVFKELGDAVGTAAGAIATYVTSELTVVGAVYCPPILFVTVPGAVASIGILGYAAYHLATDPFTTVASANKRQQEFAGWREINKGQGKPAES